jgi:hypothetical protein
MAHYFMHVKGHCKPLCEYCRDDADEKSVLAELDDGMASIETYQHNVGFSSEVLALIDSYIGDLQELQDKIARRS